MARDVDLASSGDQLSHRDDRQGSGGMGKACGK